MLFKLNLALLAAAPIARAASCSAQPSRIGWRQARLAALGWSGGALAAAVLLGVRGELSAYLDTIAYNFHYASALGESDGVVGRATDHLRVARDFFELAGRWQLPLVILVLAVFAVAAVLAAQRGGIPQRMLAGVAAATLLGSLATIGLTAYWEHHLQLLAYPALCIAAALISVQATSSDGGPESLLLRRSCCSLSGHRSRMTAVRDVQRLDVDPDQCRSDSARARPSSLRPERRESHLCGSRIEQRERPCRVHRRRVRPRMPMVPALSLQPAASSSTRPSGAQSAKNPDSSW